MSTEQTMGQRILVVDDDRQIVRLVQSYLEQSGYHVLTAGDGASALRLIQSERPDLVVLDLMLPDQDGWAITRVVRADPRTARLPILMLTARVEDADRIVGLEIGADDYVTKPFNPREVVARVRAILRRAGGAAPEHQALTLGALRLDADQHLVTIGGQLLELTPTEFDLLRLFLGQPGHAFTRQELIEQGLGYAYEGLERTIDSHIKNLRKKLERDPSAPQIETVYGVGYRLHLAAG
jgi:two-component system, OmpR family, alkaline phosphatase synthesis response regulator PhoP